MKNLLIVIALFCSFAVSAQKVDGNKILSYKLSAELVQKVMASNTSEKDRANRQVMIDFIERFCGAYEVKDIDFIQKVFSGDTLLFVGGNLKPVLSSKRENKQNGARIEYMRQSKKQYLSILHRLFSKNASIEVLLDDVVVKVHPDKTYIYGLTLRHGWTTGHYGEKGYLFMLWDFSDTKVPKIYVRTWQPDMFDGTPVGDDEIFTIDDFDV